MQTLAIRAFPRRRADELWPPSVSAPAWPVGPPSTKLILLFLITVAIGAWVAGPKSPDELGMVVVGKSDIVGMAALLLGLNAADEMAPCGRN